MQLNKHKAFVASHSCTVTINSAFTEA